MDNDSLVVTSDFNQNLGNDIMSNIEEHTVSKIISSAKVSFGKNETKLLSHTRFTSFYRMIIA